MEKIVTSNLSIFTLPSFDYQNNYHENKYFIFDELKYDQNSIAMILFYFSQKRIVQKRFYHFHYFIVPHYFFGLENLNFGYLFYRLGL